MTSPNHKALLAGAAVIAAAGAAVAVAAASGAISAEGPKPAVRPGTVTAWDPPDGSPNRWEFQGIVSADPPPVGERDPNRWEKPPV